jgi:hypothetical protein
MKQTKIIALIGLITFLIIGCSSQPENITTYYVPDQTINVTQGEEFIISVPDTSNLGLTITSPHYQIYTVNPNLNIAMLKLTGSGFESGNGNHGDTRWFKFKALARGTTQIKVNYYTQYGHGIGDGFLFHSLSFNIVINEDDSY